MATKLTSHKCQRLAKLNEAKAAEALAEEEFDLAIGYLRIADGYLRLAIHYLQHS